VSKGNNGTKWLKEIKRWWGRKIQKDFNKNDGNGKNEMRQEREGDALLFRYDAVIPMRCAVIPILQVCCKRSASIRDEESDELYRHTPPHLTSTTA
jgi:hypothetical protein